MVEPQRTLIVNADDLGLSRSVNDAVFGAWEAGNISSATLMVNMPGSADAAGRLAEYPGLGVGLHFSITEGRPLAGPSSLTDERGEFVSRTTLLKRSLKRQLRAQDIRREFELQLQEGDRLGVALTHVDSHQHVMMLPAVFDAIAPAIAERKLPVRLVQPPRRSVTGAARRPKKLAKQLGNRVLALRHRRRHGFVANDELVSVHDLDSAGPYSRGTYLELVGGAGAGTIEVMVHPYIVGNDVLALYSERLEEKTPFLRRCAAEYDVLVRPGVFEGFVLRPYGDR